MKYGITVIFEEIYSIFIGQFHDTLDQDIAEMAQFLRSDMKQVEYLLFLPRKSRQRELKYYFARDLCKYIRLVTVYLAPMWLHKNTDEETCKAHGD